MSDSGGHKDVTKDFLGLLMKHEKIIFSYILTILPNYTNAEDVYQETVTTLWEKFGEYQPGTNFGAWSCVIAKYKVLQFNRKNRNSKIKFDEEAIKLLEANAREVSSNFDDRSDALKQCIKKLSYENRQFLKMRYENAWPIKRVAETVNRSVQSIYNRFNTIHHALMTCIERSISE